MNESFRYRISISCAAPAIGARIQKGGLYMERYDGDFLIYLRKSRADLEAERRGEGETLTRHERALLELASRLDLHITEIYREIVSGETIAARPVMQQLLSEVERGIWSGVLVMEVERLARGDTIDQGIVAQAFKFSGTKIVTPSKTYDPENEFDEEYFEFGLFMSRREYKTINRRLQRGRAASIKEGKYVGSIPPYGYERTKLERDKGYTLSPDPEQAPVVKMIYELYTKGEPDSNGTPQRIGLSKIAKRLDMMGIRPKYGDRWTAAAIRDLLKNPVYTGKLRWEWRKVIKRRERGHVVISRPRNDCVSLSEGLHEPLIDQETYDLAQEYLARNVSPSIRERGVTKNPLAGLVICGKCGKRMQRRPYLKTGRPDTLICPYPSCDNVGSDLAMVEERIIAILRDWLADGHIPWDTEDRWDGHTSRAQQKALMRAEAEISALEKQQGSLHDLLEQGVYDIDTFLARSSTVSARLQRAYSIKSAWSSDPDGSIHRGEPKSAELPQVENLFDLYNLLSTPAFKNEMLKAVLITAVYTKNAGGRWKDPDDLQIDLYPKIPRLHG